MSHQANRRSTGGKPTILRVRDLLVIGVVCGCSVGHSPASAEPANVPATQPAEALAARIDKLIAQLASEKHKERDEAQKALIQIGKPAIRALEAAGSDKDSERASRARVALRQIAERFELRMEHWRNRWEGVSLSFRVSVPAEPSRSMSIEIDTRGKATARMWDARRKALVRYESTLTRKELDSTARRLGQGRPWDLRDVPRWPASGGGTIAVTITVDGRFVRIEQPWPAPAGLPRTRENGELLSALARIRSASTHLIETVRRDAAIRAEGGTVERRGEAVGAPVTKSGGDRAAIQKVLDLLDLPWQTKLTAEQLDKCAASIRPNADEAVVAIMKQYNGTRSNSLRHRAVQVLQRLGTAKARGALLDVALGRTADKLPSSHGWAARAYLTVIPNKADARELLASNDSGVLNAALLALRGQPVDEELMERLRQIARRKEGWKDGWNAPAFAAADVASADPRPVLLEERVALLVDLLSDVAGMPGKDKPIRHGHMNRVEAAYFSLLIDLTDMPAEAGPLLKQASAKRRGVQREVLIIARARRGDATAREGIGAILADKKAGLRRAWAARALGVIGSAKDLPLLKRLAETDPLARERGGDVGPPGFRQAKFYPVREAAKDAIRAVEQKAAAVQPATQPARADKAAFEKLTAKRVARGR